MSKTQSRDAKFNNITSGAVEKATGKTWRQWLKALDVAGCGKMSHKEIVAVVSKQFDVGPWWQQQVTVGYEQARGLREKGQKPDGYEISVSKTINASAEDVFKWITDPKRRAKWMDDAKFEITTATPSKSIRMKWLRDDSRVSIGLYPKGAGKVSISMQHSKLKDAVTGEKMKKYWAARVEALKQCVEK